MCVCAKEGERKREREDVAQSSHLGREKVGGSGQASFSNWRSSKGNMVGCRRLVTIARQSVQAHAQVRTSAPHSQAISFVQSLKSTTKTRISII